MTESYLNTDRSGTANRVMYNKSGVIKPIVKLRKHVVTKRLFEETVYEDIGELSH